ncbi:hypothetical protein HALDL1_01280 (plasmid) [Halobacterium sp. DL1]|nr:hypothetical protein HALDL1_01280 [Halobacterium sp. DL1]
MQMWYQYLTQVLMSTTALMFNLHVDLRLLSLLTIILHHLGAGWTGNLQRVALESLV